MDKKVSNSLLTIGKWAARIFLYLWCAFSVFVFVWLIVSSLKTNKEFFKEAWKLPSSPQVKNYTNVFKSYNLGNNFLNSIVIVSISVLGILVVSAPVAYVLTRCKFFGNAMLNKLFAIGMGVPNQLMIVPLFFQMNNYGLLGSKAGLILVYIALSLPFTIFLMQGFFDGLPKVLEEAAYLDGCTPIKTFFKIMLPLGRPGIVTAAIFNFVGLWNEFMLALTFIRDSGDYPLSVGLYALQGSMQYVGDWVGLMASVVIATIPTIIIYCFLSKQIIAGLTMGAVKE